jgi:hypothetical protein
MMAAAAMADVGSSFPLSKAKDTLALRPVRYLAALAAPLAAALTPSVSQAQDTGVVYAGGSAGNGFNVYAGAVTALPGGALGRGLALRGGASGGRYKYVSGAEHIEGEYISGEVALVYQTSGRWGWANFSAGPRVSHTALSPDDLTNSLRGTRWDAALQIDGAYGAHWRLEWFGSAGVFTGSYNGEVRMGPLLDASAQTRMGLEAGVQGDDSYTKGKLGVFVSTLLADKLQGRIAAGFTEQQGRNTDSYAALSVSRTF